MEQAELKKQSLVLATALPDRHRTASHMLPGHVGMLHQAPATRRATCRPTARLPRCCCLTCTGTWGWWTLKKRQREARSGQAKTQAGQELIEGAIRGPESFLEGVRWKGEGTQERGAES